MAPLTFSRACKGYLENGNLCKKGIFAGVGSCYSYE